MSEHICADCGTGFDCPRAVCPWGPGQKFDGNLARCLVCLDAALTESQAALAKATAREAVRREALKKAINCIWVQVAGERYPAGPCKGSPLYELEQALASPDLAADRLLEQARSAEGLARLLGSAREHVAFWDDERKALDEIDVALAAYRALTESASAKPEPTALKPKPKCPRCGSTVCAEDVDVPDAPGYFDDDASAKPEAGNA